MIEVSIVTIWFTSDIQIDVPDRSNWLAKVRLTPGV
jgi:hypothetical protein